MAGKYTTHKVAQMANIHRDTLLRWLREGRIPEPSRDRNGWRAFTDEEAQAVVHYVQSDNQLPGRVIRESIATYTIDTPIISPISKLEKLNWDFAEANTGYLTHSLHPYPAKFIPQIPNALIQELSSVGDTVLDPFCGSGTTLVEALLLKRYAVGIDANPLACLIASAKTTRVTSNELEQLNQLLERSNEIATQQLYRSLPLFPNLIFDTLPRSRPNFDGLDFWFDSYVIDELSVLKALCLALESEAACQIALTAFSSIIVAVSRQDSDTRYVRREKSIQPGDTIQRFIRALSSAINKAAEFAELTEPFYTRKIVYSNVLEEPSVGLIDLVVCSPPYPNAYSYHLYHRTRMLWLDMDQPSFKKVEIGSHRKYSNKSNAAANADTFRDELRQILTWLRKSLRLGGYACFVIGDSILKGKVIQNDQLLMEVAKETGYSIEANLTRRLHDGKKSFNPMIGKIKNEHVVILRNRKA